MMRWPAWKRPPRPWLPVPNRLPIPAEGMARISEASQKATALANDVRHMLAQQSDASHDVAISMEALSMLVDKNHHTVGDIGTSMSRLRSTSDELHALVKHLESAL